MSYEYSSESRRFDVPNPFQVENLFRFTAGGILLLGGFLLLLVSRGKLVAHTSLLSVAPVAIGIYLIVHGVAYIAIAMTHLRFFFGRGEPSGLAPEVNGETGGASRDSEGIKETMRQNTLIFKEPTGALNGLLYSTLPQLIFAPPSIQSHAQRQFQTVVAMAVTLVSLLVAWIGFPSGPQSAWLGLFYFLFSAFLLIRPMRYGVAPQASLQIRGLLVLILVAIFGPVLIPLIASHLPDISPLSLNGQAFFLLLAALSAVVLFFVALIKQLIAPPSTSMGCDTHTVSFNAHPKQLLDELDREMQNNWTEKIPNRRYAKVLPVLAGSNGEFFGESLEETQPMPSKNLRRFDLASCFAQPRYKCLGWLNILGLALMLIAVIALVTFGVGFDPNRIELGIFTFATFGFALLIVAHFCFKAGHQLWERFEFLSELVWVEMKGNYQAAKVDFGSQLTDHVQTQKHTTNIETMTLRVWVVEIDTVCFGKNGVRTIVGMRGLPDKSRYLASHLAQFAGKQSVIVAPTTQEDMHKIAALGVLNKLGSAQTIAPSIKEHIQASELAQSDAALKHGRRCAQCTTDNDHDALFCTVCGSAFINLI